MTADEHLQVIVGQLIIQVAMLRAEVDHLKADADHLQAQVAERAQPDLIPRGA